MYVTENAFGRQLFQQVAILAAERLKKLKNSKTFLQFQSYIQQNDEGTDTNDISDELKNILPQVLGIEEYNYNRRKKDLIHWDESKALQAMIPASHTLPWPETSQASGRFMAKFLQNRGMAKICSSI